jgi:menaquinone-dependent protoporphyrinogen oxidase
MGTDPAAGFPHADQRPAGCDLTSLTRSCSRKEAPMINTILVAHATKHGSTREVAEWIARRLGSHDLTVELKPAAEVGDVAEYDAVVLGAALYMGRLVPDARRFLARHRTELAARPFAIFAMGPLTTSEHDVGGATKQLEAGLAKAPELHPFASAVFGGVVDPAQLRFPFSRMKASDARDWNAIETWSDELAVNLRREPAAAPV